MSTRSLRILLLLVSLLYNSLASAQQNNPQTQPDQGKIYLDVVVTSKSGSPVTDLSKQDFTLLDNKVPQSISSFRAVSSQQAPVEVILLVDAVNAGPETVAYERAQLEKFLSANSGRLDHPTTFAVFTEVGTQIRPDFTTDGKALAAALNDATVRLRTLSQGHLRNECPGGSPCPGEVGPVEARTGEVGPVEVGTGEGGPVEVGTERLQLSLKALETVAVHEAARPGRKLVLWISPGWPLLSNPSRVWQFSSLQLQEMFRRMVGLSTQLQQARITLYSIDPLGLRDVGIRTTGYGAYLKGISNPKDLEPGNLGLQVFAAHSGGLVLNSGNDLAALLQQCFADTQAYYEISFDPPGASRRDEFHHLEFRIAKPGLHVRTLQGYYAQPSPASNRASLQ
jgi:VWFA-related protein